MSPQKSQGIRFWVWLVIGLIVAAIVMGLLYYIGWLDAGTHVDTPQGDNVTDIYRTAADSLSPSESAWQNPDGQTLDEVLTEPDVPAATPPTGE